MTAIVPSKDLDPEQIYALLAEAIDRVGPDKETLFLTRLALLLGCQATNLAQFEASLKAAEDAI